MSAQPLDAAERQGKAGQPGGILSGARDRRMPGRHKTVTTFALQKRGFEQGRYEIRELEHSARVGHRDGRIKGNMQLVVNCMDDRGEMARGLFKHSPCTGITLASGLCNERRKRGQPAVSLWWWSFLFCVLFVFCCVLVVFL